MRPCFPESRILQKPANDIDRSSLDGLTIVPFTAMLDHDDRWAEVIEVFSSDPA
jgi:hypothetical protein